ncbi:MAG TPA: helix-turn-helix domain-containing protein [Vicinamibacteria bacterium]|nr:helix-turn-helix domain-containing protein [Vicinamibacteria bacterium]
MSPNPSARSGGPRLKDLVDAYERGLIDAALAATRGNQRQAAFRLGILPTTLHEKMKRLRRLEAPTRASRYAGDPDDAALG